jgi:hypothetical protein
MYVDDRVWNVNRDLLGTVREVRPDGNVEVEWDDGRSELEQPQDLILANGADRPEDVVVFKIEGRTTTSYARGTQAEAEAFIRSPKWPARASDNFIAADEYGHGTITAASRGYENWLGKEIHRWRQEVHSA